MTKFRKVFLNAIVDIYDRRIVSYVISDTNDLVLPLIKQSKQNQRHIRFLIVVVDFNILIKIFITDLLKLKWYKAYLVLKNLLIMARWKDFGEWLNGKNIMEKNTSRTELVTMITNYMDYYNNGHYQRKLKILTPIEFHNRYYEAV